jgi:hypothetical protein
MTPSSKDDSGLVRWLILREEVRDRAREAGRSIRSRVRKALRQNTETIPPKGNDRRCVEASA